MDLSLFPEKDHQLLAVIAELDGKGGEEYEGGSEMARRNPVKADTAPALTGFTSAYRPQRVLEMGTAYGFSTLHFVLGNRASRVDTVEFYPDVAEQAQANFERAGADKVTVHATSVGEYAEVLAQEPVPDRFSMVFIDHDKSRYLEDFMAVENHLAPGCVVLADNVNDRRGECGDFVDYVVDKYPTTIIPTQAGLLVATIY